MMSMLHALSSTFTTCACGAKAKDCALTKMAEFVDGQTPPTPSPSPPSIVVGDEQPLAAAYERERSRIRMSGSEKGGKKKDGCGKVDLGPLVGVERGFRTKERMPNSGGMYGVEMISSPPESHQDGIHCPSFGSSNGVGHVGKKDRKGKGKMTDVDAEIGASSNSVVTAANAHDSDDSTDTSTTRTFHPSIVNYLPGMGAHCDMHRSSSYSHIRLSFPCPFGLISSCEQATTATTTIHTCSGRIRGAYAPQDA